MNTTKTSYSHKVSARLTDKQLKAVQKAAKTNKMSIAEYIRACIL
jgi:predicted HicB family RNase H-like nuclease